MVRLDKELEKIKNKQKNSKTITQKEAEYHKWKGSFERNPDYFGTKPDRVQQNVPEWCWEMYVKETGIVSKEPSDYENEFIWSNKINDWNHAQAKSISESKRIGHLVFFSHAKDVIKGKPQIFDEEKKRSVHLIIKAEKKDRESGEIKPNYKMIGDPYNRRDDGYEVDILDKSYWVYNIIHEGDEYIVLTKDKIMSSEIHNFYGMEVKINNSNEINKDFKCKGSVRLFFCKSIKPTIMAIPKDDLMNYVINFMGDNDFDSDFMKQFFTDFLFTHENGNIYRQPEDYMIFRHAQLLSGKVEGYPLSTLSLGVPGCSKTMEVECINQVFGEGIMEAGNSTPKSLVPSFKEKPANPGYIMGSNRVALIDELMKMIDNQILQNGSTGSIKNQLAQLNYLLEHKKRSVGSGNDNSFTGQTTAKTIMVGNPAGRMSFLHEHIKVVDESTLSRLLIWIKGFEHKKFVQSNKIVKSRDTYTIHTHVFQNYVCNEKVFGDFIYNFYLTVYDSCQKFVCDIDDDKVRIIFNDILALVPFELKNVWAARGLHHTKLLIDGITKFNCIFRSQIDDFVAVDEYYEEAEKLLIKMASSWSEGLRDMY